ncbi:MAG: sodium:calcium antiporter [Saprospirales bacterium]|nr:MAG: sodium:calcium antiporter [Saprospirales bacterium]
MVEVGLFLLLFAVALGFLIKGSDWFVISSEKIGTSLGASPFIIGLTIVAFGTSLPELATSIFAMLEDESEIVLGNVVGSNVANIFLVLGLLALFARDIKLDFDLMESDLPALIISALLLWFVLSDGDVSLMESFLLLACLGVFIISSLYAVRNDPVQKVKAGFRAYVFLVIGGLMVYFGSRYTVFSIVALSEALGIGTDVISLTLVAIGTSLPEIAVSISAAKKGYAGIAVGNVVGSNIFNTYIVVGIASFFGPLNVTGTLSEFSLPVMVAATFILAVSCLSKRITKWEGALFLLFYVFFMYRLFT